VTVWLAGLLPLIAGGFTPQAIEWRTLQPGVEFAQIQLVAQPSHADGILRIVRIDSTKATLVVRAASAGDGKNRTAAQWAKEFGYLAVINAGMYETDFTTHTGYLRLGGHLNSKTWVGKYKSVLTVDPKGVARIQDTGGVPQGAAKFQAVVQNLRLIAGPGKNVWGQNPRKWSEAAVAMDKQGRILLLFCRTPFSMHDFNAKLLGAGLQITHAQHVEGGPEASLSIHAAGLDLDLSGSYETGFNENDGNREQWPLPNVIAVVGK